MNRIKIGRVRDRYRVFIAICYKVNTFSGQKN